MTRFSHDYNHKIMYNLSKNLTKLPKPWFFWNKLFCNDNISLWQPCERAFLLSSVQLFAASAPYIALQI